MKLRSYFLAGAAILGTSALAVNAQVPGVNSTLASVFTLAYDNSTMMPTYAATVAAAPAVASQTDMCSLYGSASKTIKVRRIWFSNVPTAAVTEPIAIVKRTTAATGAGAAMTVGSYDSSNPATSSAKAEVWTAAPTVGTLGAVISDLPYAFPLLGVKDPVLLTYGELGQPIVLRGVAQSVNINLNAITLTGTVGCTFEWTEQ